MNLIFERRVIEPSELLKLSLQNQHIDWSMQERRNSIAKALELRLSCTNPSIFAINRNITFGFLKGTSRSMNCFAVDVTVCLYYC